MEDERRKGKEDEKARKNFSLNHEHRTAERNEIWFRMKSHGFINESAGIHCKPSEWRTDRGSQDRGSQNGKQRGMCVTAFGTNP